MTLERKVLIIDDCPEDRETYRRYLLQDTDYTYVVIEEESGEKGLELCRLIKPDSVLLDYLLPDIDGLEFLDELRDHSGKVDIPVVMVTGYGNEAIAVQAMKSGALDYLVKGKTTSESLRLALRHAMEKAELLRQLEKSEERFRTSVENMLDCFGIYSAIRDASGCIVDFRIEYVNEAACTNNQMTRSEQLGRGLCELMPVMREIGLFDEYCQVVKTGQSLSKEALIYEDIYNQQILIKALDIRVTKLGDGVAVAWRDITKPKQAEEQIKFQAYVVSQVNDAVLITEAKLIDLPGPRILYANAAFTQMTGYNLEEVLGKTPRILQGPKTDRAVLDQIRKCLATCDPLMVELINYRKDGSEFWVETNIVPMVNETGECTHWIAVQRDITERKQIEEKLAQLLEREQAARAEAEAANRKKDEFLAIVSHELRSPLNSILAWTQLLQTRKFDQVTTDRALETIKRSVKLQNQLIEDLMDISRIIQGKLRLDIRPIELIPTIEATLSMVLPSSDAKSIKIESLLDSSIGQVLGDSSRLQQVVWNLLTNAIKFTPEGGHIMLRLERVDSYAQLQVSDTGQGISAEFLPYVFEQFRQADTPSTRVHNGLGLGLAIVRRLVELHNGTVQAASEGEGQGAIFTVKLPLK
jgi:PAS domain S-box-containing protein